jgi:hypothetical protein
MATSSKIQIMISSRCKVEFPAGSGRTLTDIRKDLKKTIQALEPFGKPLFKVWINEDSPPASAKMNAWDYCLSKATGCDILLVIYDGD